MFRLVVHGLSAHGCVREEGVSAVEKFVPLFAALRRLEAERCGVAGRPAGRGEAAVRRRTSAAVAGDPHSPLFAGYRLPWPIEVGTVRAGDWASSVPDTLVAEGRYGVAVGEDVAAARRAFEEAIARAAAADPWLAAHPPEVEWWGGRFDPAVTTVGRPDRHGGDRAPRRPSPARRLRSRASPTAPTCACSSTSGGIPTVLFGPGDVRVAHMPDEYVPIDDLRAAAQTLIARGAALLRRPRNRLAETPGHATPRKTRCHCQRATSCATPREADLPAAQAVLDAAESHDTGEPRSHDHDWPRSGGSGESPGDGLVGGRRAGRPRRGGRLGVAGDGRRGDGRPLRASRAPRPRARGGPARHHRGSRRRAAGPAARRRGAHPRGLVRRPRRERRQALDARGFAAVRQYYEMAIDLKGRAAARAWPAGIEARAFRPGVDDRRV